MFITNLPRQCQSSRSLRNYVSGIQILHRELGLSPTALDSFQVHALIRVVVISMRTLPLR